MTDGSEEQDLGLEQFVNPDDDQGISLDELSEAYAELLSQGDDPYHETPKEEDAGEQSDAGEIAEDEEPEAEVDTCEVSPSSILEAILFVGTPDNAPLTNKEVATLMRGVRPQEIDDLVAELNKAYDEQGTPYTIVSDGPGYRLVLRDEYKTVANRFYGKTKDARLSQAAVDVLAVVAYNQPIGRKEIDDVRGKPSGALLTQLVRRELLAVQRTDTKPRRTNYVTTERFLRVFGLENIDELPRSQELDRAF